MERVTRANFRFFFNLKNLVGNDFDIAALKSVAAESSR
jgi:hypothetical protein